MERNHHPKTAKNPNPRPPDRSPQRYDGLPVRRLPACGRCQSPRDEPDTNFGHALPGCNGTNGTNGTDETAGRVSLIKGKSAMHHPQTPPPSRARQEAESLPKHRGKHDCVARIRMRHPARPRVCRTVTGGCRPARIRKIDEQRAGVQFASAAAPYRCC